MVPLALIKGVGLGGGAGGGLGVDATQTANIFPRLVLDGIQELRRYRRRGGKGNESAASPGRRILPQVNGDGSEVGPSEANLGTPRVPEWEGARVPLQKSPFSRAVSKDTL